MLTSTQKKSIARLTREITTPEDDVIHVKIPKDRKTAFYAYLDRHGLTVQGWTRDGIERTLADDTDGTELIPYSEKWEKYANRLARDFSPRIYPCSECGWPVASGYCCRHCGSSTPEG